MDFVAEQDALKHGEQYKAALAGINDKYELPSGLLFWVTYQESKFRPEIIDGREKSPAGAVGMFQFEPPTARQYGVTMTDWRSSADGAARYLLALRKQFGDWSLAVAAYNNGPGNVAKRLKAVGGNKVAALKLLPTETKNYVRVVAGQIGQATALTV